MSSRERLGWNSFFEGQRESLGRLDLRFARVVEEQRGVYRVAGDVDGWAEVSGRFRHDATSAADFPAVGDWVGVQGSELRVQRSDSRAIIHVRLNRCSTISRAAAGTATTQQVVAANVDTIFLVTALSGDLNPRRLERYLTVVWEAGAVPVVLLNKADLCDDPEGACESVRARLPFVEALAVSAVRPDGLDLLVPYLTPAHTIALLGSSGVGKSTIVNRLLGREAQRVAAIRESDGRGRHTTTSRQLVELPSGALLIDTPGMRELQPWAEPTAIDAAFDDVASLARECRFGDCSHETEPECAVREAVTSGRLDADRLEHYRRLAREAAFEERKRDKAAAADWKRRARRGSQAIKALYRNRER